MSLGLEALRSGAGGVAVERDVVRVSGSDASAYLQGQISQDVESVAAGESAWSLILQPQGRIDAWFRSPAAVLTSSCSTWTPGTPPGWSSAWRDSS